jgi:predicted aspartyl protease
MQIEIRKKKAYVEIEILMRNGTFRSMECLVDTGFNGSFAIFGNFQDLITDFDFLDLKLLEFERWIRLANNQKVQTYLADMSIIIDGKKELTKTVLVDSEGVESYILGIDFLRQNKKRLIMDFQKNDFRID